MSKPMRLEDMPYAGNPNRCLQCGKPAVACTARGGRRFAWCGTHMPTIWEMVYRAKTSAERKSFRNAHWALGRA